MASRKKASMASVGLRIEARGGWRHSENANSNYDMVRKRRLTSAIEQGN